MRTLSDSAGRSEKTGVAMSLKIYLGLVLAMIVLQGLKTILPLQINPGQQTSWLFIAVVAVLGWIGVNLTPKAGFPEMWDSQISQTRRFLMPALIGVGAGVVMFLFDILQPMDTEAQTIFPDSLVVFALAGLVEEIIIHLFLTTLLIWLISEVVLRGRYQNTVFWIVAVGGAILYWLLQMSAIRTYFPEQFTVLFALQIFLVIVVTITAGAYFFRKGGFLAALSLRYGFYLVWHIIWAGGIGLVRYFM